MVHREFVDIDSPSQEEGSGETDSCPHECCPTRDLRCSVGVAGRPRSGRARRLTEYGVKTKRDQQQKTKYKDVGRNQSNSIHHLPTPPTLLLLFLEAGLRTSRAKHTESCGNQPGQAACGDGSSAESHGTNEQVGSVEGDRTDQNPDETIDHHPRAESAPPLPPLVGEIPPQESNMSRYGHSNDLQKQWGSKNERGQEM